MAALCSRRKDRWATYHFLWSICNLNLEPRIHWRGDRRSPCSISEPMSSANKQRLKPRKSLNIPEKDKARICYPGSSCAGIDDPHVSSLLLCTVRIPTTQRKGAAHIHRNRRDIRRYPSFHGRRDSSNIKK